MRMRLGECGVVRGVHRIRALVLFCVRQFQWLVPALCAAFASVPRPRTGRDVEEAVTMTLATSSVTSSPTSNATWTPERIEQLRTCIKTGLTCSQIAAEIGVTRNAVIGKIHRLGLSTGRPPGAAPTRVCIPREPRPRVATQRRLLRLLFADVASRGGGHTAVASATAHGVLATVDSMQPCSLFELTEHKCRWPISDDSAAACAFCGNHVATGFSYCAGHARMAYRLPSRRSA
jgi:GcrA cell cycle regulator